MRRLLMTAMFLCGLMLLPRAAHAQTDNQCPNGCDNGGGSGAYDDPGDHANCMTGGNICGQGWNTPYTGSVPTNPHSTSGSSCVDGGFCTRYCDAIEQAVNELHGEVDKYWTGLFTDDGEPIYEFYAYYPWWGNWAFMNGSGVCSGR